MIPDFRFPRPPKEILMARTDRGPGLQAPSRPQRDDRELKRKAVKTSSKGVLFVDYKNTETLRRLMSGNGKMQSRRRTGASAMEQRLIARAIKRARFMGMLPFVEATV
jgi:small subunit ribosomal protein S18